MIIYKFIAVALCFDSDEIKAKTYFYFHRNGASAITEAKGYFQGKNIEFDYVLVSIVENEEKIIN